MPAECQLQRAQHHSRDPRRATRLLARLAPHHRDPQVRRLRPLQRLGRRGGDLPPPRCCGVWRRRPRLRPRPHRPALRVVRERRAVLQPRGARLRRLPDDGRFGILAGVVVALAGTGLVLYCALARAEAWGRLRARLDICESQVGVQPPQSPCTASSCRGLSAHHRMEVARHCLTHCVWRDTLSHRLP